jgi:2-polyprenyl-3-methyl-5-hydroxy-6-metoxy-1,4-benzoquinol methylase
MPLTDVQEREKDFYDQHWTRVEVGQVTGALAPVPEVNSLAGKRVLICSCGSGVEPLQAAKAGAEVNAFDISRTAVENAMKVAATNQVTVRAQVMALENLQYGPTTLT